MYWYLLLLCIILSHDPSFLHNVCQTTIQCFHPATKKTRNITLRFEYICTNCTVAFQFLYHYSSGAGTSHPSTGTWAHHRSSVRFCWLLWSVLWTIVFSFCLFYRLATVLCVLLRYNASDNPFGTAVLSAGYR